MSHLILNKSSGNSARHQVSPVALNRTALWYPPTFDVLLNNQLNQNAFLGVSMMSSDTLIEMYFPQ
jgi:hypothetical protein